MHKHFPLVMGRKDYLLLKTCPIFPAECKTAADMNYLSRFLPRQKRVTAIHKQVTLSICILRLT